MKFGLEDQLWERLLGIFKKYPEVEEVVLYGSRARGDFAPHSDIDLAIVFSSTKSSLANIRWDLASLPTLHKIDVIDYNGLKNQTLKDQIDGCKKQIYRK